MNRVHAITYHRLYEMNIIQKIARLYRDYLKKRYLKSFDEIEPNVFVLKDEIVNRLSLNINRIRKRKSTKRNYK